MTGPDPIRDLTCDEVRELAGAFVLGALPPAEEAAVRAHLETCDDAHAEIAELGGVLPVLAESAPVVEPPAGLKARIMAAAAADLATRQGSASALPAPVAALALVAAPAPVATPVATGEAVSSEGSVATVVPSPTPEPTPFPAATERAGRRRASAGTWALRIAAVLAIVLLGGWNLLLQGQLNAATSYQQSVATVLDVAAQPGSKTAILTAAGGTGSGLAAISASGDVTMAMQDLAPTTGNTVYTAWVIGGDGVPVALGDFTVGSGGTASFQATGAPSVNGVVLALTLEPGPGATKPTSPVISKGVATGVG